MRKKLKLILFFTIAIFIFYSNDVLAAFPSNLTKIYQSGKVAYDSAGYGAALKKSKNGYSTICTLYSKTTPAGKDLDCLLNNEWSNAVRAGVATILRSSSLTNKQTTAINTDYLKTELTINYFLYQKNGGKSDNKIWDGSINKTWYNDAVNKHDEVNGIINNISISIGAISKVENDDSFTLTTTVSGSRYDDYNVTVNINGSTVSKSSNTITITIPKSSLSDGDNNVTITVRAYNKEYIARNYTCGSYQPLTPQYTELTEIASDSDRKTVILTKEVNGTVKLIKKNTNDAEISGKDVGIKLYNGHNCDEDNINNSINKFRSGDVLSLTEGAYSIKETTPPSGGYEVDTTCHNFIIEKGKTAEPVIIINQSTCVSDVLDLIESGKANDRLERIKIYNNYNTLDSLENRIYTNLLNFNLNYTNGNNELDYANSLCSNVDCGVNDLESHCLYARINSSFDKNNLACYNLKIDKDNKTGFCYTTFNFDKDSSINTNKSGNYYFLNNNIKNGRFVFKSDYLGTVELSQTCYFEEVPNIDSFDTGTYDDYVTNITFNGKELSKESNSTLTLEKDSNFPNIFKGEISVSYTIDEVYVEKISGKVCSQDQIQQDKNSIIKKCKNIGRGLISNFNDVKNVLGDNVTVLVPFYINLSQNKFFEQMNNGNNSCAYSIIPEIIKYNDNSETEKGILNIEFRTIDTNNPFNRNTKSNWSDGLNNNKNNNKVKDYITNENVNNSYNRTGGGSLYQTGTTGKIILTSKLVQQIRDYNESHPYDDYTVYTEEDENGNEITSTSFFDYIGLTKVQ